VAIINVGVATKPEMKEKKARVEFSIKEGISASGSVALLKTSRTNH
jgi:hypothetical protein